MICGDIMREPQIVDKDENIARAFELLERKKDTHVVVTDEGKVVGIVSVKDLLRIVLDRMRWGTPRAGKLYVSAIMTPNPLIVDPETKISHAASIMIDKGISSLIVGKDITDIEEIRIITKRDILQHWDKLFSEKLQVAEIMSQKPLVIHPGTSIKYAEWMLRNRKISTLPVVDEGELVGYLDARILSFFIVRAYLKKDIKHFDKFLEETTVSDAMKAPHFVSENQSLEETAQLLVRKRAKGSPVIHNRRLTGIVTETDFTRLLVVR